MGYRTNSFGLNIKLVYVFIYLIPLIGSIVFLVTDSRDREIRLHCLQMLYFALILGAAYVILGFIGWLPFVGFVFRIARWVIRIVYFLIAVIGLSRACCGTIIRMPILYQIAERGCAW